VIHGLADELLDRMAKLDGLAPPHLTINDGITAQAYDISTYKIAAGWLTVYARSVRPLNEGATLGG